MARMRWKHVVPGVSAALLGLAVSCECQQVKGQQRTPLSTSTSSASIRVQRGKTLRTTVNSSFVFVSLLNPQGDSYNTELLRILQRNTTNEARDGIDGLLRVGAWSIKGNHKGRPLWTVSQRANEAKALPDLGMLVATSYPCCSAMWVNQYFSLRSGKHLYTTNGDPALTEIPETGLHQIDTYDYKDRRFIGFGASYEKGHDQPELQYGSDSAVKQRFALKGHEYGDNFDVPELQLLDANGKEVKAVDGAFTFTIVLRFKQDQEPAAEVRVPVVNDVLRTEHAILPRGYSLVAAKL